MRNENKRVPLLTREEEKQLIVKAHNGDRKARNELIVHNFGLVEVIARNYTNRGLDLDDLVSEGYCGLITAADKVDPSKNNRFSTYASFWIKEAIGRALSEQGSTIRLPAHQAKLLGKVRSRICSLEKPLSEDGKLTVENSIADERYLSPEEDFFRNYAKDSVLECLKLLSAKERKVLRERAGIGCEPKSLREIGEEMGFVKERIRQIEKVARAKFLEAMEEEEAV